MSNESSELRKSPIFALTLGGKELCHSNFWAWLINQEIDGIHPFIEIFIPDFYKRKCNFIKVERESKHRDLTIFYEDELGKKVTVIENKLKSIPTKQQINDYKNIQDKIFPLKRGFLLV